MAVAAREVKKEQGLVLFKKGKPLPLESCPHGVGLSA